MREIRLYGSEGGGAAALPTPILRCRYAAMKMSKTPERSRRERGDAKRTGTAITGDLTKKIDEEARKVVASFCRELAKILEPTSPH